MSESNPGLVEKRQRFIERQRELHKESVNVRFEGRLPEGSGRTNRHGMPSVRIGQHLVKNWPVLDLGEQPDVIESMAAGSCRTGRESVHAGLGGVLALPQTDDVSDFHSVTTWSRLDNHWRGVRFSALAGLAGPKEDARYVLCTGYDFMPGTYIPYTVNIPLARALEDDVLLVHTWEGRPLAREHGGPCRMITPKLYAWKGAKWIRKIELLARDRKGFWEERGYSNTAEPWFDDRYSF
jgi:DMSO/TMAO reductase YedYZ molybdopterin-dependent catalytic subunit